MEYPASELSGVRRDIAGVRRFSSNTPSVPNDLFVWAPGQYKTHSIQSVTIAPPLLAASATRLHIEYTMTAVAQLSIPPLSGRK